MRVAIASSGLGHINRGVEAWASDLAAALHRNGIDVTLFQADGPQNEWTKSIWCLRRTGWLASILGPVFRHIGAWRIAVGNDYEVEQASFSLALWPRIHAGFDILHVQDPTIALIFETFHRRGVSRPRVILGNGTVAPALVLGSVSALQHLSPAASAEWLPHRPLGQKNFVIPNFVDTEIFRPGDKGAARAMLAVPADSLIVLSCGVLSTTQKRTDYLIREFEAFLRLYDGEALLVIAGSPGSEAAELMRLGTALLGDRVRFLIDHPRSRMPELYRAADLFALASLQEPFGIVLVEAMAAGLPIVCHESPISRHVVGPAGMFGDLKCDGALARMIREVAMPQVRSALAAVARQHVEERFSVPVVVEQIRAMYRDVSEAQEVERPIGGRQPA